MGKGSKLRVNDDSPVISRWQDENGYRKLYDNEKMPDGIDPDVWHLATLFRQKAEELNFSVQGPHIVYTELVTRIGKSGVRTLTPRVRACTSDTTGRPCDWIDVIERMIDTYYSSSYFSGGYTSIDSFCSADTFDWLLQWSLDTMERELLIKTAAKVPEERAEAKPRRDADVVRDIIMNRSYTEDQLSRKMRDFKSR